MCVDLFFFHFCVCACGGRDGVCVCARVEFFFVGGYLSIPWSLDHKIQHTDAYSL